MSNYENVMGLVSSNKNVRGVAPYVLGPVLVENGVGKYQCSRESLHGPPHIFAAWT